MLSLLNHPNVARLVGASILDPSKFLILTEFAPGGSLFSVLHVQKRTLDLATQVFLMTSLARGMHYLHNLPRPIIHRDLNSHNVLLNAAGQCVVIDFGEARFATAQDGLRQHESFTLQPGVCYLFRDQVYSLGSCVFFVIQNLRWMAPEIFLQNAIYTVKADVFSFALVVWELVVGRIPFENLKPGICV